MQAKRPHRVDRLRADWLLAWHFDQRRACHECDSLGKLIEVIDRAFVSFGSHQQEAKAVFFERSYADRSSK